MFHKTRVSKLGCLLTLVNQFFGILIINPEVPHEEGNGEFGIVCLFQRMPGFSLCNLLCIALTVLLFVLSH